VLLVLVVAGTAGFTWFAYWPLEGSVPNLERLVPDGVDFVYRGSWKRLKQRPWFRQNVLQDPLLPEIETAMQGFEDSIRRQIAEQLEAPINRAIPFGITTFSVEDDVFPAETYVAGRFCEEWGPERGRPLQPREWLVLTRTTWKVRFISALKHGFVRSRLGGAKATPDDVDGVWRIQVPGIPVTDTRLRSGCGDGFIIPPEDVIYLGRVKDVLAISNSRSLVRDVAALGETEDVDRSILARRDFRLEASPDGVAAAVDIVPLHKYLIRVLEQGGSTVGFLDRFVTVNALDRFLGTLEIPSPDTVRLRGDILYDRTNLTPEVERVFSLPPQPVLAGGIAPLIPAQDTFAVVFLRSSPVHLMTTVWEEFLPEGERRLVLDNLRRAGAYQRIEDFFQDLAQHVDETAAIAVARLGDVYDKVEYPDWYNDPVTDPDPQLGFALWVHLRQSARPEEVDEFLAERLTALGFKKEVRRVTHRGIPYTRLDLEQKSADFSQVSPAYMLVQEHLVLANNEDYFRKIIDTIGGAPSMAGDPTFRATMESLADTANVAAFVDLAKVFRVPPTSEPGAMPRGIRWDQRNLWVQENRDSRDEAKRHRESRLQAFHNQRKTPSPAERSQIEAEVDELVARWQGRYPEFIEEYRRSLEAWSRFRSAGLTFTAGKDVLQGRFVLLLQPVPARTGAP
jgi:hypothetical protein